MKIFKNFKETHEFYNYPSSYRFGTIYNEKGVIRSYSNGEKDIAKDNYNIFYYELKNELVKRQFENNIKNKKKLRLFRKINGNVYDLGLYSVDKFYKNFVKLIK